MPCFRLLPTQGLGNVPECGELPVAQEPSLRVDGGVVSAAMGVNAADDNASALGHAGTAFPLGHEPGQARTGRAGGHTSDKAWSHKLVSGHTKPVRSRALTRPVGQADSSRDDTTVRAVQGQTCPAGPNPSSGTIAILTGSSSDWR